MAEAPEVKIWTDGSVATNPGPGGWAWLYIYLVENDGLTEKLGWGYTEGTTTNQRMEMTAVCEALEKVPLKAHVIVYSDSAYIVNCINEEWYVKWKERGWTNSQKKHVANRDLWERMLTAIDTHESAAFTHVKGHLNNEQNNMVHELAFRQARKAKALADAPIVDP